MSQKASLTRHIKAVHTKIKDQKCPHCDYVASRKDQVSSHIKKVHESHIIKRLSMTILDV
jgi:uncharacterized C2H2 Zn-finger protein